MAIKNIIGAARWIRRKTESKFDADLTQMDREDLEQSAAEGIVRGIKRKPDNDPYIWQAGSNQCLKAVLVDIFGRNPITTSLNEALEVPELPDSQTAPFVDELDLIQLFLNDRNKKGERGLRAAERDAKICRLLMQGTNNAGIAQELGIPEHDVRSYRSRIRKTLSNKIPD